jgi:hypothetical protein
LADEKKAIYAVLDEQEWRTNYDCATVDTLFWQKSVMQYPLENRYSQLNQVAMNLAIKYPATLLRHQLCLTEFLWRISPRQHDNMVIAIPSYGITQTDLAVAMNLKAASIFPVVKDRLVQFSKLYVADSPILGRPALLFLVGLYCAVLLAVFDGRGLWLIYAPAILNAGSWVFLAVAQDYRYQYPAVATSLLMLCVTFSTRNSVQGKSANSLLKE